MLRAGTESLCVAPWDGTVLPRWTRAYRVDRMRMHTRIDDMGVGGPLRRHRTWEPELSDLIQSELRPGMSAIDIGANIGYFTVLMSRSVGASGSVLAVEPVPVNYQLLMANLSINLVANVEVVAMAADREHREVRMVLPIAGNLGSYQAFGTGIEAFDNVPCRPLDDVLDPSARVDLIKMDAQGMDFRVVEGAMQTIARWRPLVLLEYEPFSVAELGDDPVEVLAGLSRSGFVVELAGWELARLDPTWPGASISVERHLPLRGMERELTSAMPPGNSNVMLVCRYVGD